MLAFTSVTSSILTAEQQRSGRLDAVGKHPDELLIDLSGALAADLREREKSCVCKRERIVCAQEDCDPS